MELNPVILLGLGFTTRRLAMRLLVRGIPVFAAVRNPERFGALASLGVRVVGFESAALPAHAVMVNTIPPLPETETDSIRRFIRSLQPRRIIYISSTSVYGSHVFVTAATAVDGSDEKGFARLEEEERWVVSGNWSSLVLRPAGIYGPGRGVHVRVREGKRAHGAGAALVSRIHCDDLAATLEVGALSSVDGAWPVADEHPCSSEEIALWCARLFRMQPDNAGGDAARSTFSVSGRSVDGRHLRTELGLELTYPSYQEGILASVAEERARGIVSGTKPAR